MIDFAPLINELVALLAAGLFAVLTWAAKRLTDKLGMDRDHAINDMLDEAIEWGVHYAREKALAQGERFNRVEVRHQLVADAANYVMAGAPKALKHFGITEERLQQMVMARLDGR